MHDSLLYRYTVCPRSGSECDRLGVVRRSQRTHIILPRALH